MKLMENTGFLGKTLSPAKRLVLLSGLSLLVFSVIALLIFGASDPKKAARPPQTKEEVAQVLARDSDNDGLKDWEEKIYGTNPEKSDSDGDGTSDGQEIKDSRNPLKSGPGDNLSIPLPPPENENRTHKIANEFLGQSLSQIIAEGALGQPLDGILQNSPNLRSYLAGLDEERILDRVPRPSADEFRVVHDNSPAAVKKYFNTVAQIYLDRFSKIESDINILYDASTSGNTKLFAKLDANVVEITKAIEEIKEAPTPSQWLDFAKGDVWYLSKTLAAVKILRNSEKDPAASLLILNDRMNLLDDFGNLYAETKAKLAQVGIIFSKDEPAGQIIIK